MHPLISVVLIISENNKHKLQKTFDSLGFEIQKKDKEYIQDEVRYKKVIDNYLPIELIIANRSTATLEKGIFDKYHPLSSYYVGSVGVNDSITYMHLIEKCSCDYICVIEPNILLDTGWLEHLLQFNQYVNNSGIISIAINPNEHMLSALLNTDDTFSHVLIPENNILENLYFFKKEIISYCPIPYTENNKDIFKMLCQDANNKGYKNYYITTSFAIKHA